MKLRRALVAAATAAALAPAALVATPAAFAADTTDTPDASESSASASASASASESAEPSASASSEASQPAEESSAPEENGEKQEEGEVSGADARPPASASTRPSGSAKPSESASAPDEGEECEDAPQVSLSGFPSKVVAGGDWSRFTLTMKNTTDKTYEDVYPVVFLASADPSLTADQVSLQYYNPVEEAWLDVADVLEGGFIGDGYLISMPGHTVLDIAMRVRFTADAPVGPGVSLAVAGYFNEDGSCGVSASDYYFFNVLAPGKKPGDVKEVKPKEGARKPIDKKPQGGTEQIPVTGSLATTGANSALPAVAGAAGAALLLGAGTVFIVRRRRSATAGSETA